MRNKSQKNYNRSQNKTAYEIIMGKVKSFESNVANTNLIYDGGGTMPIGGKGIGAIKHVGNKDIEIEFRECRLQNKKKGNVCYQVPYYAEGVLKCHGCDYSISTIDETDASLYIYKEKNDKIVVLAGRNKSVVRIECVKMKVKKFREIKIRMDKVSEISERILSGEYFNIELAKKSNRRV